jgi:outer membrane protein TolC
MGCLVPFSHARAQPDAVTLDQALRRALQVQPAMVQAAGNQRVAQADSKAATGAFLPRLSTSAGASRAMVDRDSSTPDFGYGLGWNASLTLFDGFARIADRHIASANLEAADAGLRGERFQVMLDTKQIFYAAAASDDLVRVATAQLERARTQFDAATRNLEAGAATISDSLRATVEVGNARIALLRAQAANSSSRALLGRQIGVDGPVTAIADSTLPLLPDAASIYDQAQTESPAIISSQARSRAADAGVTVARSRYWPSLGLSYGESYAGQKPGPAGDPTLDRSGSLSLGLSWSIFDGFAREAAQASAEVRRDVASSEAQDTRRQVSAELTRQLALLTAAYDQIDIARINVLAAGEDFRVTTERYRLGVATSLDLTTSQANLTQAEVGLIQARFEYLIARAEIEAIVGREL